MRAQSTSPSRSCRTELRQCRFTQPLTALFLAVRFEVEHRIVAALGHQAQPARDLLIGLDLAAQVAAEAILVELFIGDHVPQAAAVGADLVGEDDAAVIAVPDAPEFELEVDQEDADAGEQPRHEIRSEEHTSELQSLMRISYAVFCV